VGLIVGRKKSSWNTDERKELGRIAWALVSQNKHNADYGNVSIHYHGSDWHGRKKHTLRIYVDNKSIALWTGGAQMNPMMPLSDEERDPELIRLALEVLRPHAVLDALADI
jgi:hypothetical protein